MEQIKIYKYKLEFYYKSLIVYMLFLILYTIINETFFFKHYSDLYKDPIFIISVLFIIYYLFVLLINMIKAKELIFNNDKIIIKNRFGHREIVFTDIISIRFSKERKHRSNERSQISKVKLKLKNRKRFLRIRLNEFWDEKKLYQEFKNLSKELNLRYND
jgi:hypothetical protein